MVHPPDEEYAAYAEAKAVPMNMPDSYIKDIQPIAWERERRATISKETIQHYQEERELSLTHLLAITGKLHFYFPYIAIWKTKALRVQDIAVYDIILANEWKRPIYFASTCSPDAKIGLEEYMWFKGLSWKLEPAKASESNYGIDPIKMEANLMNDSSISPRLCNMDINSANWQIKSIFR